MMTIIVNVIIWVLLIANWCMVYYQKRSYTKLLREKDEIIEMWQEHCWRVTDKFYLAISEKLGLSNKLAEEQQRRADYACKLGAARSHITKLKRKLEKLSCENACVGKK